MTLAVRLVLSMIAIAAMLGLMNWLVLRRVAAAFRLGRRGRRAAVIALGVPLVATILFRGLGARAPVGFAEPLVIATSAFEAAIGITGAALLLAAAARRARSLSSSGTGRAGSRFAAATGSRRRGPTILR